MTVFDYLNENREICVRLYELGLMKYKVEVYYSIYSRYLYYKHLGNGKTRAVTMACHDHHTCDKTGFAVIREMETKI